MSVMGRVSVELGLLVVVAGIGDVGGDKALLIATMVRHNKDIN